MTTHRRHRRGRRRTTRGKIRMVLRRSAIVLLLAATAAMLYLALGGTAKTRQVQQNAQTDTNAINSDHGTRLAPIRLPADESPHDEVFMEWWYYNGHLDADDGRTFGFHYTVFVVNPLIRHTVFHVSVIDLQTGQHYGYQEKTPGRVSSGTPGEYIFKLEDLFMRGGPGPDVLKLSRDQLKLNLTANDSPEAIYHDGDGLLDFGSTGGYTYYYTRPRIPLSGSIVIEGEPIAVSGDAWFDHQWGNFTPHDDGWDWFALQFEDGGNLMLFFINDDQGQPLYRGGSFSDANGTTTTLSGDQLGITPSKYWTSPRSQARYPIAWTLDLAELNEQINVEAIVADAEFDARATTTNIYWEGPVKVSGDRQGRGYVELTGYVEKR